MKNDGVEWKDCWKKPVKVQYREITETIEIKTREGTLFGYAGKDVLLKGIKGEVYPCKIDIFNATYTTTAPLSDEEIRTETAKEIFAKLEKIPVRSLINFGTSITDTLSVNEFEALKKEYKVD
jgi:hypothetical protein